MEILKTHSSFFVFLLGVIVIPLIENIKERVKNRRTHNAFSIELNDEIINLKSNIIKMASTFENISKIKEGNFDDLGTTKFIPRKTTLFFLMPEIEQNYCILSKDQRDTLKAMIVQIEHINKATHDLSALDLDIKSEDSINKHIRLYKRYIYTALHRLDLKN